MIRLIRIIFHDCTWLKSIFNESKQAIKQHQSKNKEQLLNHLKPQLKNHGVQCYRSQMGEISSEFLGAEIVFI